MLLMEKHFAKLSNSLNCCGGGPNKQLIIWRKEESGIDF